ncbi:uncharacterized protein ELE39_000435 [Cryptosporidium sp. chipmunk genotype I]|uniref:uncharacterized protein n=1 Tax=Cryptosporidium sp. chipmunk genotype I TaxID=1280935 RepID=UPI00351A4A33|nr:hypothetical protein ELE39_000435 [Cryptosporidium sp. chipmunk genotype I]
MPDKKASTSICGFEKRNLETIKTILESLLNREHILDNAVIQECFNKDVLGFSLDSVSNLQELEEICSSLLGKDPKTNRKELMHAISLAAGMSEFLNLSVYSEDCSEINLGISHSSEGKKLSEKESTNTLLDASKFIMEFLEAGREKDIYIKPIFKAERTTLILRDLDNDVIENEIFDLLKKCPHFHIGGTSGNKANENSPDAVRKLVVNFRKEVHGTWFITLKTEDLTTKVALWLRGQKLRDDNSSLLRVGIKSEHPIASLLSVLSVNKGIQSVNNRMSNLQISGAEMGIGISPMIPTLHTPLSSLPPNISGNELGNMSTGNCLNGGAADGLSSHRGALLGNVSPKVGYMVNIPACSNAAFIQAHHQINKTGLENDQPSQDVGNEPKMGMDNVGSQNSEHMTVPLPVMYPYHRGIGRTIGVTNHTSPLNVYGPISGAPNGGIIAPIMVVSGATIPGNVPTSPPSSPILEASSPNAYRNDTAEAIKSPKKSNHKRRGSKASDISDIDAKNSSPDITNRRNGSETVNNVFLTNEVENCGALPVSDGVNSAMRVIPQGATAMIHGIAPFYYGISGLPEVQPVNLQYLGSGPHPGSHPHIFIHGNPQFQYHHQIDMGISGAAVQGDPANLESCPSNSRSNPEANKDNTQSNKSPQLPPIFPAGYYQNVHYIGEESLGGIGSHGFTAGSFAMNSNGGNGIVVPGNLTTQNRSFWVRSPLNNNTGNQRFKSNGRKNNNSSGNRTGTKSGPNFSNPRKSNPKSSSMNGSNPESTCSEPRAASKTGGISQSPINNAIPRQEEIVQYEHTEMCSTNSSKQYPSYEREVIDCSPSEGGTVRNYSSVAKNPANTFSSGHNEDNQISKKLSSDSSLPADDLQGKQAFSKTFKPFSNSVSKSRSHRNGKKSSNGNGNSGLRGSSEHNEYRPDMNNDKLKVSDNSKGSNGPHNLATETGFNYHHRRRTSKQINTGVNGAGGNGNFTQGKYNGYENNHLRVKRTAENEQSHFNSHGKHSGGYYIGKNDNNGHGNQTGSHKSKGNAVKGNCQEAKGIGLENFPSLSDAMATRK